MNAREKLIEKIKHYKSAIAAINKMLSEHLTLKKSYDENNEEHKEVLFHLNNMESKLRFALKEYKNDLFVTELQLKKMKR